MFTVMWWFAIVWACIVCLLQFTTIFTLDEPAKRFGAFLGTILYTNLVVVLIKLFYLLP